MALGELTSPEAVRQALDEYDELGKDAFLARYGFSDALRWVVIRDGETYPSKAIAGRAYSIQFPNRPQLRDSGTYTGGEGVVRKLRSLGFEVAEIGTRPTNAATLFEAGRVYRRRDLHDRYGGQRQGGISTPRDYSFVLCITGASGAAYGYQDSWDENGVLHYFGEGQVGDMSFSHGNLAVRDHAKNGEALYVFEGVRPGFMRFLGEFVCAGYELREAADFEGSPRTAIVFQLVPLDATTPEASEFEGNDEPPQSLSDLRRAAVKAPGQSADARESKRRTWVRSEKLRRYVRARADGICEGCDTAAPFQDRNGRPYLEPHHTRRLSDGGPDHPRWVVAVCPTCHARVHYAADGEVFNEELMQRLGELEAEA